MKKLFSQIYSKTSKLQPNIYIVLSIIFGLFFLLVMGLMMSHSRLNFDEGYNLQVPLNLLQFGIYGSRTLSGFTEYDPFISSGPLSLFAVTASFAILGIGVLQARLVSAIFATLILVSIYGLSSQLNGRKIGVISLLLIFTVQESWYRLGTVVGDGAGIALILVGLVIWSFYEKKQRWQFAVGAGVLWGAAVWAKPSMIMAVLFVVITLVVVVSNIQQQSYSIRTLSWAAVAAIVLGSSWFLISTLETGLTNSLIGGSPVGLIHEQFSYNWGHNLGHNLPLLSSTIALGVVVGTIINLPAGIHERRFPITRLITNTLPLAWIVWWMLFNGGSYYRHLFPGLIFGIIPLSEALGTVSDYWRTPIVRIAIVAVLLIGAAPSLENTVKYITQLEKSQEDKRTQEQFAAYVANLDSASKVMGWGWFMAWDIAFLSNRTFGNLQAEAVINPSDNMYLAITPTISSFQSAYASVSPTIERCSDQLVYDRDGYRLYHLRASCLIEPNSHY